jgi:hypothetical protein
VRGGAVKLDLIDPPVVRRTGRQAGDMPVHRHGPPWCDKIVRTQVRIRTQVEVVKERRIPCLPYEQRCHYAGGAVRRVGRKGFQLRLELHDVVQLSLPQRPSEQIELIHQAGERPGVVDVDAHAGSLIPIAGDIGSIGNILLPGHLAVDVQDRSAGGLVVRAGIVEPFAPRDRSDPQVEDRGAAGGAKQPSKIALAAHFRVNEPGGVVCACIEQGVMTARIVTLGPGGQRDRRSGNLLLGEIGAVQIHVAEAQWRQRAPEFGRAVARFRERNNVALDGAVVPVARLVRHHPVEIVEGIVDDQSRIVEDARWGAGDTQQHNE